MKRGLITALFLIGALASYILGEVMAATALFFVGAALELVFWVRLLRGQKSGGRRKSQEEAQALETSSAGG